MHNRVLPIVFLLAALVPLATRAVPPNVVIILADDLGYGDLSCYGHPTIHTPNLDRMAAEGIRFTDFYVAETVCSPSRAALMTGRLPIRSGMFGDKDRVLMRYSTGGLPDSEITLPSVLKGKGYATACIGKWHIGHQPQYFPMKRGFDSYLGLLYSNDMERAPGGPKGNISKRLDQDPAWYNARLFRDDKMIEQPADLSTLTKRYTEEAEKFIAAKSAEAKPFFLYLAYNYPHVPLFASEQFKHVSARGLYGDVVEEIDASVGRVMEALKKQGVAENTLVFFTSDNGPWLIQELAGGSAGLLRDGKGSTFEGGMREPAIAWWPGRIKPGQLTHQLATTMDLFPTIAGLAGAEVPKDRPMDGVDIMPLLTGGKTPRETVYYYRGSQLFALRHGVYKAHFITRAAYGPDDTQKHEPPLLYNLESDPSERFDVAAEHPEVVTELKKLADEHRAGVTPVKSIFDATAKKTGGQGG